MHILDIINKVQPGTPEYQALASLTVPQLLGLQYGDEEEALEVLNNDVLEQFLWDLGEYQLDYAKAFDEVVASLHGTTLDGWKFPIWRYDDKAWLNRYLEPNETIPFFLQIVYKDTTLFSNSKRSPEGWAQRFNSLILHNLLVTNPKFKFPEHISAFEDIWNTLNDMMLK